MSIDVTVDGRRGEVALAGQGELRLDGDAITLCVESETVTVPIAALRGASLAADGLTLYAEDGDVITVSGPPRLSAVAHALVERATIVPESTRALRALGSARGKPTAEQTRFFAGLLAARRRAERSTEPATRLSAFDPDALVAELDATIAALSAARFPRQPPERRATIAALEDLAIPYRTALGRLRDAMVVARDADDADRFTRWRGWCRAIADAFVAADRCWLAMLPVLERAPVRAAALWRRALRLGVLAVFIAPAVSSAQHLMMRATGVSADSLRRLDFDVVESNGGATILVADSVDRARLTALGVAATSIQSPLLARSLGLASAAAATVVFRSFDDPVRGIKFFMDSIARNNPIVHLDTIGTSLEGRPMLAAKIGAADDSPNRPNVLFMATYHAREWAATEMALRLLTYLAQRPAPGARVDSLLQTRDIWIIPVANPDGYQYTFSSDRLWRKNRRPLAAGAFGIDLNRNHESHWGLDNIGSSNNTRSETYRGPSPASEPEIQVIEHFHALHPPVTSLSYHTYGDLVLYPPGYAFGTLPGDLGVFRALAGTNVHPSVMDHLPDVNRDHYMPGPGWLLYTTNGEYTDWAYEKYGTLAFTTELTSGQEGTQFYGFEFPDNEQRLDTVFRDNLPFALDLIESARNPFGYLSATTAGRGGRIEVQNISPWIGARVPATGATTARVEAGGNALPFVVDSSAHGAFTKWLISSTLSARPSTVSVESAGLRAAFASLAVSGAEAGESGWVAAGFATDTGAVAGTRRWTSVNGTLRSPIVRVGVEADTLSVLFWNRLFGASSAHQARGEVRVSRDSGATWQVAEKFIGAANAYYPERVTVSGVRGKPVQVEFAAVGVRWDLDEIALVSHTDTRFILAQAIAVSANPVRGSDVYLTWPFAATAGDFIVYDFAGREVWRTAVAANAPPVRWNVAQSRPANGVYVVVARAGNQVARQQLLILR
jgi:hypothetical protein